jgi:hypothetical protein
VTQPQPQAENRCPAGTPQAGTLPRPPASPTSSAASQGRVPCPACGSVSANTACGFCRRAERIAVALVPQTEGQGRGKNGAVYHHVGTGVTTSTFWCRTCEGYYGVPHGDHDHSHRRYRDHCACAPWQKERGIYPTQGVFIEHDRYLAERAAGVVHSGATS